MSGPPSASGVPFRSWPKREHFFTFNWGYLAGVTFFAASAWLSEGPLFILVVSLIAGVVFGCLLRDLAVAAKPVDLTCRGQATQPELPDLPR